MSGLGRRHDEGTTTIEFAFVVLLLLTATFGAVDFGLWMFQKSEASQAAREASRVAMIQPPTTLGVQTSGAIYNAARAELESNLSQFTVSVSCETVATPVTPDSSCTPDVDTVTVTVSWHRDPLTVVGMTDAVTGTSSRTVVGLP